MSNHDEGVIYRLRMKIKFKHRCPTCACTPKDIVETSFNKEDLLDRVETASSREAQATQEVVDWAIDMATLEWK